MVAGQSSRVFGAFGDAKTKTTCNMTNTLYPQVSNDCVNHFVFFSDDDDDDGDDDDMMMIASQTQCCGSQTKASDVTLVFAEDVVTMSLTN